MTNYLKCKIVNTEMPVDPLQLFAEELMADEEFIAYIEKAGVESISRGWALQSIAVDAKNVFHDKNEYLFKIKLKKEVVISGLLSAEKKKEVMLDFKNKVRKLFNSYFKKMGKKIVVGILLSNQLMVKDDKNPDRSLIFPKYDKYKAELKKVFKDIDAEVLVYKPKITDVGIIKIMPEGTSKSLMNILRQDKTEDEKDQLFSELTVPICRISDLNFVLKKLGLKQSEIDEYIYDKNQSKRQSMQQDSLLEQPGGFDIGTYGI
jgi:hypothetical protein